MSIRVRRRPTRFDRPVEGVVVSEDGYFMITDGGSELRYLPITGPEVVVYESQTVLKSIIPGAGGVVWVLGAGGLIVVVDAEALIAVAETSLGTELQSGCLISKSAVAVATCSGGESSVFRVQFEEVLGEPSFTAECIYSRNATLTCISTCGEGLILGFTDDSLLLISLDGLEKRLPWSSPATPRCSIGTGRGVFVGCSDGSLHCVTSQGKCIELPPVHTSSVMEIFKGDDAHIWTLDDTGKLVLWSQTHLQPKHTTTLNQDVSKVSVTTPFNSVQMVAILNSGRMCEWDVGHSLSDGASPQNDPHREGKGASDFLVQLCQILKGQPLVAEVPSALVDLDEAIPFLPEALRSLAECRRILVDTFGDFGWSSESLHQDLQRVVNSLQQHRRQGVRAEERAIQLMEMCPQFELPNADSTDRLLFACDCALEGLTDRLASSEAKIQSRSDADEARSTNYVLQSRIAQLEQQVERQTQTSRQAQEQISQYEADVRELTTAMQRSTAQYERRLEELMLQIRTSNAIGSCATPPSIHDLAMHLPREMREHVSTATDIDSLVQKVSSYHTSSVTASKRRIQELESECTQLETELDDVSESEKTLRHRHHRLVLRCREGGRLLGELEAWVRRQQFSKSQEEAVTTRLHFVTSECLTVPDHTPPNPSPTCRSTAAF